MWRTGTTRERILSAIERSPIVSVLDTETTGFSPEKERIIQCSAIKYEILGTNMREIDRMNFYICPPFLVPTKIENLTGITNEFLINKPKEEEVFPQIHRFLENTLIAAYNADFDVKFLKAMYERQGEELTNEYIDVLEMARDIIPKDESPSHKLGDITRLYGADRGLKFHSSMDDVIATSRLMKIFLTDYHQQEPTKKPETLVRPMVYHARYWRGYRGMQRIYVSTNKGTLFWDMRSFCWGGKDMDLNKFDMEYIRNELFKRSGTTNEKEMSEYYKEHTES